MTDMPLTAARRELRGDRVRLLAGTDGHATAVADFYRRNHAHLAPWDPPMPADFHTHRVQLQRLRRAQEEFAAGSAYRYWVVLHNEPERVIGTVHFSQISRGAFHNGILGYAIDHALEGQGLMHESVQTGLLEMFSPRVNLHRVQAGYRPENQRSGQLLARLGFEDEGLAREYMYIDGEWRDHRIMALRNPAFLKPGNW